jgi:RNA polymerase primary sigma factor
MFEEREASKAQMLTSELTYDDEEGIDLTAPQLDREDEEGAGDTVGGDVFVDAEAMLSQELAATSLLTRDEEAALAVALMGARRRLLKALRGKRRLTRAALERAGRGVVTPDDDFREREALLVWRYARRLVRRREAGRVGLSQGSLKSWVVEFKEMLDDYRALRDRMVQANLRLVSVLARRYRHPTLTYLDLFQEGVLGLLRAVEKYDPERNVRFATYATWWIWQQLGRSVDTYGPLIRTPVHWSQLRRRLRREEDQPAAEDSEAGAPEAVGQMDPQRLEAIAHGFQYISTDTPLGEDDERLFGALLADDGPAPEEQVSGAALRRQLDEVLSGLPQREQLIVRQRFGLGDQQIRTLDEIGRDLGVSRERIRQLEARALHILKRGCEERGLRDHLH